MGGFKTEFSIFSLHSNWFHLICDSFSLKWDTINYNKIIKWMHWTALWDLGMDAFVQFQFWVSPSFWHEFGIMGAFFAGGEGKSDWKWACLLGYLVGKMEKMFHQALKSVQANLYLLRRNWFFYSYEYVSWFLHDDLFYHLICNKKNKIKTVTLIVTVSGRDLV